MDNIKTGALKISKTLNSAVDSVKERISRLNEPTIAEWVILAVIIAVMFVSHIYWDIVITTRHGINLWYSLFDEKNLFDFYFFNHNTPITGGFATGSAIYPFPTYIVFAVWNFPLYIAERFLNFDVFSSPAALTYAKAILLPFLAGSAFLCKKICLALSVSAVKAKWCAYYFISGSLVFFSLVVVGQYDIFSTFFCLAGVYCFIKNYNARFILFFAIAFPFKMFALFIFIPLLLLKEKRVIFIVLKLLIVASLYLFSSALFDMPEELNGALLNMVFFLFRNAFPLTSLATPVFVVATLFLWVWCYSRNLDEKPKDEQGFTAVFTAFLAMAVLFVTCSTYFYWAILMAPFMCIMCFKNTAHSKLIFLLEMMASGAMIFTMNIMGSPAWNMATINNSLLPKIFGPAVTDKCFGTVLGEHSPLGAAFAPVLPQCCTAVFAGGTIAFAALHFSRLKQSADTVNPAPAPEASPSPEPTAELELETETQSNICHDVPLPRSIVWGRLALNFAVCGMQLMLYLLVNRTAT